MMISTKNVFLLCLHIALLSALTTATGAEVTQSSQAFKNAYIAEHAGKPLAIDRLTTQPSGLSHQEMLHMIGDPEFGETGLQLLADLMTPEGSVYYDAIFGPYYGQKKIRAWLIPAMQGIAFIKFVPLGETTFIEDGAGGTSIDEWHMATEVDGAMVNITRGISIRKFRDGWINYAADVYDTGPFRRGPPPGTEAPADTDEAPPELPPYPKMDLPTYTGPVTVGSLSEKAKSWIADRMTDRTPGANAALQSKPTGLSHLEMHQILNDATYGVDFDLMSDMMHPTEMVYVDPIFGAARGQQNIRDWLVDIMGKTGTIAFEPIGPILFDGDMSVQEFKQMAVLPNGDRILMVRGASVRRFKDGWLVYAADYFDTAPLSDPEIQAASTQAGSAITVEDIMKYRTKHTEQSAQSQ
jgi:hypothetical protein